MTANDSASVEQTRRQFLGHCGLGVGALALHTLLHDKGLAAPIRLEPTNAMAPRKAPLTPRAKRVIYLFMAGGPSQLELFEDKPKLRELTGQAPPASLLEGKRFAFLKGTETLLGSQRTFGQYGECGPGQR